MLFTVTGLVFGIAILIVATLVGMLIAFNIIRFLNAAYRSPSTYREVLVLMEISATRTTLIQSVRELYSATSTAQQTIYNNLIGNMLPLVVFTILAVLMFVVLNMQPLLATGAAVFSQCTASGIRDGIVMPFVNYVIFLLDILNPLWIVFWRIYTALTTLHLVVLASCADINLVGTVLAEIGNAIAALFTGLIELISTDVLKERWDISMVFYHIGQALIALLPALSCYCTMLNFLLIPVLRAPSFISFATGCDCLWNVVVRLLQLIPRAIFGDGFRLTPLGNEAVCAWLNAGDVLQDIGLQLAEVFTGVIYQFAVPCSGFSDPTSCENYGYCAYDGVKNVCRPRSPCDAFDDRDTCDFVNGCCWSGSSNANTKEVSFSCASSILNQCPALGVDTCHRYENADTCTGFGGACAWDPRFTPKCQPHATICTTANNTSKINCEQLKGYCGNLTTDVTKCDALSGGRCFASGNQCSSYYDFCVSGANDPAICAPYQFCVYNTDDNTCVPRDIHEAIGQPHAQFITQVHGNVTSTYTIPPPGTGADAIAAQFGINALVTILQLQWAHGLPIGEPLAFLVRLIIGFVDNMANPEETFGAYEGLKRLNIGSLVDHWRVFFESWIDLGLILDVDLPCTLAGPARIFPNYWQGLAEIFFLVIYFAVHQPTGSPEAVTMWSPLDFLASYFNDTRVSFSPLIFLDGVPFQWSRDPQNEYIFRKCNATNMEYGSNVDFDFGVNAYSAWHDTETFAPPFQNYPCNAAENFYEITVQDDPDIVVACTTPGECVNYSWIDNEVSLTNINKTLQRVEIFPGIDKTIPRVIEDLRSSSVCANRFFGDGTDFTLNKYPWACAIEHGIVVAAEVANLWLTIGFSIVDFLRFGKDPIYRKTPLEVPLERFYRAWSRMVKCATNVIRLAHDSGGPQGLCTERNTRGETILSKTFVCCFADVIELIMDGAILAGVQEMSYFLRDLIGISFVTGNMYLPNLSVIIGKLRDTIESAACVISSVIPDSFRCPMDFNDDCVVSYGGFNSIPCMGGNPGAGGRAFLNCNGGSPCFAGFLSSIITAPLVVLVIMNNFYVMIRSVASVQCSDFSAPKNGTECIDNGCNWNEGTQVCATPDLNISSATSFIEFVESIFANILDTILLVLYRFSLFIDCIGCGAAIGELGTGRNTCHTGGQPFSYCGQCGTPGTPIFDFLRLLLGPLFNIIRLMISIVVNIFFFILIIIIALISGNISSIERVVSEIGGNIENIINELANNVTFFVLTTLKLDVVYNALVNFMNNVMAGFCITYNNLISAIHTFCCLGVVKCEAEHCDVIRQAGWKPCPAPLPEYVERPVNATPPPRCDEVVDPTTCRYLPSCYWNGNQCEDATPCQKAGSSRQACIDAALAQGSFDACFMQTSSTLVESPDTGWLAQKCVQRDNPRDGSGNLRTFPFERFPGCENITNYDKCMGRITGSWAGVCYWNTSGRCVTAAPLCHSHTTATACNELSNLCPASATMNMCVNASSPYRNLCFYDAANSKCIGRGFKLLSSGTTAGQFYFQCKWLPAMGNASAQCVSYAEWNNVLTASNQTEYVSGTIPLYKDIYKKRGITRTEYAFTETVKRTYIEKQIWQAGDTCGFILNVDSPTIAALMDASLTHGTFDTMGHIMFCMGRLIANTSATVRLSPPHVISSAPPDQMRGFRTYVDMTVAGNCEVLFQEYYTMDKKITWDELRPLERVYLSDCVRMQLMGIYLQTATTFSWIPPDIVSNWMSKWILIPQIMSALRIYYLYHNDRALDSSVVMSQNYSKGMRAQGFNMDYLDGITTEEQLQEVLTTMTLMDYYTINKMTARDAAMGEDVGKLLGDAGRIASNTLGTTLSSFSFNVRNVSIPDILVNGTETKVSGILTSTLMSTLTSLSGIASSTGELIEAAPELKKRAMPALRGVGKALHATMKNTMSWMQAPKGKQTPLTRHTPPANTTRVNLHEVKALRLGVSRNGHLVGSLAARATATIKSMRKLVWRDPHASERRSAMALLFEHTSFTVRYQLFAHFEADPTAARIQMLKTASPSVVASLRTYAASNDPVFGMDTILGPLQCITTVGLIGTDFLCKNCLYLDQLVGNVILLAIWLYDYYSGTNPALWYTYPRAYDTYRKYSQYLANPQAPVCVGDSCELPLRFPSQQYENLRYFGDSSPNKRRLYDYQDIFTEVFLGLQQAAEDPDSLYIVQLGRSIAGTVFASTSSMLWEQGANLAHQIGMLNITGYQAIMKSVSEARVRAAETIPPLGETMGKLGTRLLDQVVNCDFPVNVPNPLTGAPPKDEIAGTQKRFAIAEVLAVGVLFTAFIMVPLMIVVPSSSMALTFALSTGIVGTLTLLLTLVYNWSYSCFPALPIALPSDIRHLLAYSVAPKCGFFFSGVYKEEYSSTTCYSCENARALTAVSCTDDLNFKSIIHNIAFVGVSLFPTLPEALRTVGLGSLVETETWREIYGEFEAKYDPNDPLSYSQYQACNWIWTLLPNAIITAFGVFVLAQLFPLIVLVYQLISHVILNAIYMIILMLEITNFISYHNTYMPYKLAHGSMPEDDMPEKMSTQDPPRTTSMYTRNENTEADDTITSPGVAAVVKKSVSESTFGTAIGTLRRRFAKKRKMLGDEREEERASELTSLVVGLSETESLLQKLKEKQ